MKHMRSVIKQEDGDNEARPHGEQQEAVDAGRERRRRPNEGADAAADETRSLRAAHAEAQAQAFGEMERARLMELELQRAKADVAMLQAEAKLKDEASQALQAVIRSKDQVIESRDKVIESRDKFIECREQLLQQAKADVAKLQAELKSKDNALQSKEAHVATLQAAVQCKDELLRSQLAGTKYVQEVSPPTLLPPRPIPHSRCAADGCSRRRHVGFRRIRARERRQVPRHRHSEDIKRRRLRGRVEGRQDERKRQDDFSQW